MRVNPIILYKNTNILLKNQKNITKQNIQISSALPFYISFGNNDTVLAQNVIKKRKNQLRRLGLKSEEYTKFLYYDEARYQRAINLLRNQCFSECVGSITALPDKQFDNAVKLAQHNVIDSSLLVLAKLDDDKYNRVLQLSDAGVDSQYLELFAMLDDKGFDEAKRLMNSGYNPPDSAYLAQLNKKEQSQAFSLMERGVSSEISSSVILSKNTDKFINLLDKGIKPDNAEILAQLNEQQINEALKYIDDGFGEENVFDLVSADETTKTKAVKMFSEGVLPEYTLQIAEIEEKPNNDSCSDYFEYIKRGYSRTSSFALSQLDDECINRLSKILKHNKEPFKYLNDEYDIDVISIQGTTSSLAIFTKEINLGKNKRISIIRTFDDTGSADCARLEEYPDGTSSSFVSDGLSDVYRVKYDKNNDIAEMLQFVRNPEDDSIIAVISTNASNKLQGSFDMVFHDIKDFKVSDDEQVLDFNISECINADGIPMSTVSEDNNGNIVYTDAFSTFDCRVKREYKLEKDKDGNMISDSYTYNIKDRADGTVLMDISRSFKKNKDGTATNIINGVEYQISYDDNSKTVVVSDGKTSKTMFFKDKLAEYYKDKQWRILKELPVDALLIIDRDVEHWNYCRNEDAASDGYIGVLSTGDNKSILYHELGHFKSNEDVFYNKDKEFLDIYHQEMADFLAHVPYNEIQFVTYLSPIADLKDANGRSEFSAESNLILSTYGTSADELKTRPMFLAHYFPRTLARTAELLGKTSKKSLLQAE